jgi:hypothetical protein
MAELTDKATTPQKMSAPAFMRPSPKQGDLIVTGNARAAKSCSSSAMPQRSLLAAILAAVSREVDRPVKL